MPRGSKQQHRHDRNDAEHEHRPEGSAPAEDVADRGADRHADDAGNSEAGKDQRHGHAALVLAHEADGYDHGDAEIDAVSEGDGDAQHEHGEEVGRQRAGRLADGEGDE